MRTRSDLMTRRAFARTAAAGLAIGVGALQSGVAQSHAAEPDAESRSKPARRLRILILGGTHFVGPAVVREALARNHDVTLFNRGKTHPELFPGIEKLRGNRYPEKENGLKALEGTSTWDAVIDIPAYYPRIVDATARLLAERVAHYVVMSSISAYADFKTVGLSEESPVRPLGEKFPENETLVEDDWSTYGGRKAACERAAANIFPERWAAVRASGIIGGSADDNAMYWPARIARGGDIVAPGDGTDPYQSVDVRDVARLLIEVVERRLVGVFNATGPARPATFKEYLEACMQATGSTPAIHWLPRAEMERFTVMPAETPQWAPSWRVPGFAR
ncbi:MAG: hypothetical protein QM760_01365 [Nibricoccus sp.]